MDSLPEAGGRTGELAEKFDAEFKAGTCDIASFKTMDELELLLSGLAGNSTADVCRDLFERELQSMDEREMVRRAKEEMAGQGIQLRNHGKVRRTVMTMYGPVTLKRTVLIPKDDDSKQNLLNLRGCRQVVPLDEYLAIDRIPLKMTLNLLLVCACLGQKEGSYGQAEEALKGSRNVELSDCSIRYATNYVGKLVYERDTVRAEEAKQKFLSGELECRHDIDGTLYIETDSAMFWAVPETAGEYEESLTGRRTWTRPEGKRQSADSENSTEREVRLGAVFSSDSMEDSTGEDGEIHHCVQQKDFVSCTGPESEFQWMLLECAVRNGYGRYRHAVILSDGRKETAVMSRELFGDAVRILNLHHLSENVFDYAKAKFRGNEELYKPWAVEILNLMENGEWKYVLDHVLAKEEKYRDTVDLYQYILDNQDSVDYPLYKKMGFCAGSAADGCISRTLMRVRIRPFGMNWNPQSFQHVMTLRCKAEAGSWDEDVVRYVRQYHRHTGIL